MSQLNLQTLKNLRDCQAPDIIISAFTTFKKDNNITDEHVNYFTYLKEEGNSACHDKRPTMDKEALHNLMLSGTDDEYEKKLRKVLVDLVVTFCPKHPNGVFDLVQK